MFNWTNTTEAATETDIEHEVTYVDITVSEWFWKIAPPVLFIVGLTGNGLTIGVIRRLGLHNQPTLVFICFLACTDSVVLLTGLPRYWIEYTFDVDIRILSSASCKLYYFFIYLSMQYSSWILVGLTIERVVKTHFIGKYRIFYTPKKVAIGLFATLCVLVLVNGHFFFTNGINDYTEGDCGSLNPQFFHFDQYVFVYIDFTFLSVVPFLIMSVGNVFLVKSLRSFTRRRSTMVHPSNLKQANRVSVRMTRMCIICTFYFLIATVPISVYFILDSYLLPKYENKGNEAALARMELAWTVTYLLQYSNYCVNFLIYTLANSRFMSELKQILHCRPSLRKMRRMSIYTTQSPHGSSNGFGKPYGRNGHITMTGSSSNEYDNSVSEEAQTEI